MDRIILSGIEVYAYGGVSDTERRVGQHYSVDVSLELDLGPAARTDAIEHTVHYGHVHDTVVETIRESPFNLLENVAARIADRILRRFPADVVTIRIQKLLPPIDGVVASAAVELSRRRSPRLRSSNYEQSNAENDEPHGDEPGRHAH
jgi:dihydroneopterin aldolase